MTLLCCLPLWDCSHSESSLDAHMRRGERALAIGQLRQAQSEFRAAVQAEPYTAAALYMDGSVTELLGDRREAGTLYLSAIDAAPDFVPAYVSLVRVYDNDGDLQRALELLEPALLQHPEDADLLAARGATRARNHDRAGALADAEHAMRLNPLNENAVALRASLDQQDGSMPAAVQLLLSTLARRPSSLNLRNALANLYLQLDQPELAFRQLERIVALGGESPQAQAARDRMAAIRATQGRFAEASGLLQAQLRQNPDDTDALLQRADIALTQYDTAAALAQVRVLLSRQPRSVAGLQLLARAQLANDDDSTHAEQTLRQALQVAPGLDALRIQLAQLLMQSQQIDGAIALLRQAIAMTPTDLDARDALIQAYLRKPDLAAASRAVAELQTLAPKRALGFYLAGLVARAARDDAEAAVQFEHAIQLEPPAVEALTALTALELAHGHSARAVVRVRAAAQAAPSDARVQNLLGDLYLATRDSHGAITQLRLATQLAPRWAQPYRTLALAQARAGDLSAATHTYEQAIQAVGPEPTLVSGLAALYERQGRVDQAIQQYQGLHRRSPGRSTVASTLALLLVTYRHDPASLDEARDLISTLEGSRDAALLDVAGWVHVERGELSAGLSDLERAATLAPASRLVSYHLGMGQLASGQREQARATLTAAVRGAPSFVGISQARSALAQLGGPTPTALHSEHSR